MITGHYVKSVTSEKETNMYQAIDKSRDQSYFLFNTTKDQLNYLRFPLGGLLKDETRKIAKQLALNVADKPDSQDICFVPNGDYASVIQKFKPESFLKGNIKDINGILYGSKPSDKNIPKIKKIKITLDFLFRNKVIISDLL